MVLCCRAKNQNARDDVDFFFNENNNRGGTTGKTGVVGLVRQDSKDSIDNYFKVGKHYFGISKKTKLFRAQPSRPLASKARTFSIQVVHDQDRDQVFKYPD